jgi:acyl-CoA thioester hydrolase
VLEIAVLTKHLGNTSFTLAAEFRIAGEERVIVNVETVYVHVDHHTLQKSPLPPKLREALERGASNVTIDHAAYLA